MKFKTKHVVILSLVLSVFLVVFIVKKTIKTHNNQPFTTLIYQTNHGFGYSISYNKKILIKQDVIPAIQSNTPFCSYEDAERVANVVLKKIYKKEAPTVTITELKQLGIQLNCIH